MLGYCYQCAQQCSVRNSDEGRDMGEPPYRCDRCGGDFLELVGGEERTPVSVSPPATHENNAVQILGGIVEGRPSIAATQGDAGQGRGVVSSLIDTVTTAIQRLNGRSGIHTAVLHFSSSGGHDWGVLPSGLIQLTNFSGADPFDAIIAHLGELHEPQHVPADPRVVENLPRTRFETRGNCIESGEPCVICQDGFQQEDVLLDLPCGHSFHEGCILPWLQGHNTCPVCREVLSGQPSSQTVPNTESSASMDSDGTEVDTTEEHSRMIQRDLAVDSASSDREGANQEIDAASESRTVRGELEGRLASAHRDLESLQNRLLEQLEEHQTLRSQVQSLQAQRASLQSEFGQLHTQAQDAVTRLQGVLHQHSPPSQTPDQRMADVLSRLTQVLGQHRAARRARHSSSDSAEAEGRPL